jgi:hypothetical protein
MDGGYPVDLPAFRSLRNIFWGWLAVSRRFPRSSCVLQGNSEHLTRFQLDFLGWTEADDSWYTDRGRWDEERSENWRLG